MTGSGGDEVVVNSEGDRHHKYWFEMSKFSIKFKTNTPQWIKPHISCYIQVFTSYMSDDDYLIFQHISLSSSYQKYNTHQRAILRLPRLKVTTLG